MQGLNVPTTYEEMVEVCKAFREKGYENPMMGFTNEETTSLFTLAAYPFFCETMADDAVIQLRQAVYAVGTGEMTIDEAVDSFGTFTE